MLYYIIYEIFGRKLNYSICNSLYKHKIFIKIKFFQMMNFLSF